jgi:hypothetical protein
MDINALSTLANQVYNLVKPILANKVTSTIAGDFSAATQGSLLELWGKIKPWFIIDEKENEELKKVKDKPEDPIYVHGFTSKLLTFLHENPEMRKEIEALLKKMEESNDQGTRTVITNSRNVNLGNITGVTGNVQIGDNINQPKD